MLYYYQVTWKTLCNASLLKANLHKEHFVMFLNVVGQWLQAAVEYVSSKVISYQYNETQKDTN